MKYPLPALAGLSLCLGVAAAQDAAAEGRETLAVTRVFTNDAIGDRHDRWRSGGYAISALRGQPWTGSLPTRPGALMEYRFRIEVIAPDNLSNPAPGDRLYAGTWWLGAHTHFDWAGFEVAAGADIAVTGEQSHVRSLQARFHDLFSMPRVDSEGFQVEDGIYLHGTVEIARDLQFAMGAVRPFIEVQAGVEDLVRAGVDLTIGSLGRDGLRLREPVTGHRLAALSSDVSGWSFLMGADIAMVESSVFLPSDRGYTVEDTRMRLRAGVNLGLGSSNLFYGVTYLSEEFVGQNDGQFVGALSLDFRF